MTCQCPTMFVTSLLIRSCVQTLYALRVLRSRGMNNAALQAVFRSTVVAKLLYAASAWSGFIKMSDRQRVDAFLRRSKKCGYCSPYLPSFQQQCDSMGQKLFNNIIANQEHLLLNLLPPPSIIIISAPDHIAKNYLNTLDASLTQTSLPESYIKTRTRLLYLLLIFL